MKNKYRFYTNYTSDNEAMALEEVRRMTEDCEDIELISIEVEDAQRACRNAYGEEMDEEDFDEIDPESDEAWFDDYDFRFILTVQSNLSETEVIDRLEDGDVYVEQIE